MIPKDKLIQVHHLKPEQKKNNINYGITTECSDKQLR